MSAKPNPSKASPLEKPKPKLSSKKPDMTFKIITSTIETHKKPSERITHQLTQNHNLTIKDLSIKFNMKNDSSSTTTHSSNNQPSKTKPDPQNSKPKLHNLSHSPINYQDLKIDKEAGGTPGKIKSNLSAKKKNTPINFNYNNNNNNEKKFEDLCQDDMSNLMKNKEKTIDELRRQNKKFKIAEKLLTDKVECLEKENHDLKLQLKSKSFFDKFMRSAPNSNKPMMFDEGVQVFLDEQPEFGDINNKAFLLSQIGYLEEKFEAIENNVKSVKNQNLEPKITIKNENDNRVLELENSIKEIFLKSRNLELLYQETKNERDVFSKFVQEKKCNNCQKEEEELNRKSMVPLPGYLKLLRLAQDVKGKK